MSQKHHQRTRAEILAKRAKPIEEVRILKKIITLKGPIFVDAPTHNERLRAEFDAAKYMPHIGAKEQARVERCYMSPTFNCSGNLRATPVIHQLCRQTNKSYLEAREQEYESVF